MEALVCDLCGGKLVMGSGGITTCESCGMEHSADRMKEKLQEINGDVPTNNAPASTTTLTKNDSEQCAATQLENAYKGAVRAKNRAVHARDCIAAARMFESICDYKDSTTLAKQCYEKAEELRAQQKAAKKDDILARAEKNMVGVNIVLWQEALTLLMQIPGWKNADEQAEICRMKIAKLSTEGEIARKDKILADGKAKMTQKNLCDYEAAIKLFESIPGWKDADEQIAVCRKAIKELKPKAEKKETCTSDINNSSAIRTFLILGESITCSNTLSMYYDIWKHYEQRKESLFNELLRVVSKPLPTCKEHFLFSSAVNADCDNIQQEISKILDTEKSNTIARLKAHGISLNSNLLSRAPCPATLNRILCEKKEIARDAAHAAKEREQDLMDNIESKVTGLGYDIIGDELSVALHEYEDARERKIQRVAALENAIVAGKTKLADKVELGNWKLQNFIKGKEPELRNEVDKFIDVLQDAETNNLIRARIIHGAVPDGSEMRKSEDMMTALQGKCGNYTAEAMRALKLNPSNIVALDYLVYKNPECSALKELIAYLGLTERLAKKENYYLETNKMFDSAKNTADFENVIARYKALGNYKDAFARLQECETKIEELKAKEKRKTTILVLVGVAIAIISWFIGLR